ncbi:MAG: hypothetical protein ACLQDY_25485 [Streptosporangiaceae bacterium]
MRLRTGPGRGTADCTPAAAGRPARRAVRGRCRAPWYRGPALAVLTSLAAAAAVGTGPGTAGAVTAAGSYPASYPYARHAHLNDITTGANGRCGGSYLCTARRGYDGPTGWGTPDGTTAFAAPRPRGRRRGCTPGQLLANPGFEAGKLAPWTGSGDVLTRASAAVPAHSGSWLAWFDGYGGAHTDSIAQTVKIPASCDRATLSFWLKITSTDPAAQASDTFTVQVTTHPASTPVTLATYSSQDRGRHYVRHVLSLRSYAGQAITLKFTGKETLVGYDTSFFEDDNAVRVS